MDGAMKLGVATCDGIGLSMRNKQTEIKEGDRQSKQKEVGGGVLYGIENEER